MRDIDKTKNQLIRELEETRQRLAELETPENERKQAEEKVREAETLRELDKLRNELLANISHELRTPLASIKGFTTMLIDYDRKLKRNEKRDYLETIDKNADRLTELIEQLLEMSRLGAGMLTIDRAPTTIQKMCREVIAEAQVRSPTHRFTLDLPRKSPRVNIDARRIRQVLDNLINNSVKHSQAGTEVTVAARRAGGELLFTVTDQGIGIPEKDQSRVFEPMFRSRPRPTSGGGGAGLGLSICKGLVEAHGGRIWIESEEGKGTRCFFTLPLNNRPGDSHGKKA
jgi:signal transduction histidine kinase